MYKALGQNALQPADGFPNARAIHVYTHVIRMYIVSTCTAQGVMLVRASKLTAELAPIDYSAITLNCT